MAGARMSKDVVRRRKLEETQARLLAVVIITGAFAIVTYLATGRLATVFVTSTAMFVTLVFAWVLFAFEATPEYHSARPKTLSDLVGLQGVAAEELVPRGRARIDGAIWQAESADGTPVLASETVVVTGAQGLVLKVARARARTPMASCGNTFRERPT